MFRRLAAAVMLSLLAASARGQELTLPQVAELMKPHLVDSIPNVLYDKSYNWGKTSRVPHAVHWHGLRPEIIKTPRNDGHWQKVKLSPRNLKGTLDFRMSPARKIDADRQAFQVYLSFMTTVDYEHQLWESGVRLYSGSTRARVKIMLWMDVENTVKLDTKKKSYIPDLVMRFKATNAKVAYDDLVVEHTAGVGGTAAKLIGEAIEGLVQEMQPDLERKLLDKAGSAIVRAADTKEIRIGLGALLK